MRVRVLRWVSRPTKPSSDGVKKKRGGTLMIASRGLNAVSAIQSTGIRKMMQSVVATTTRTPVRARARVTFSTLGMRGLRGSGDYIRRLRRLRRLTPAA